MKTLNFLTTGAAAAMLLLGSCTKDVDNPQGGGNGDGGVVEGIPTYATVSLSQRSGAGTYADAGDYVGGNSGATDEEKGITSAAVLVFNQNDVLENYVKFEAEDIAKDPKAKTFSTTTGKKRLFAVANLPDASYTTLENIFKGGPKDPANAAAGNYGAADKQLANICKIIQTITAIGDATTDNGFYMSNVYPLNETTERQVTVENIAKDVVDGGDGKDETKNNFTIYIGRMTGKVTLSFAEKLEIKSGDGAFDKDGALYRVRNNPKRFYTFPVYEKNTNVLSSPYYALNYDPIDGTGTYPAALGAADYFDNGHDDAGNHTFVATTVNSYLTENSPQDAKRHKVTFLSIKSKWTPDENATFLNADGSKVADPKTDGAEAIAKAGGTFWRVQKWEGGVIKGYVDGIYVAEPTAYTDTEGNANQNKFATDRADAKEKGGYLKVEYTNGMAYYAYWMRSKLDGAIAEKYALKRNNHYKVNIISVDGVGEPTEDDNLDKDEDIEADTYMKASIEVLNWNEVEINGGI